MQIQTEQSDRIQGEKTGYTEKGKNERRKDRVFEKGTEYTEKGIDYMRNGTKTRRKGQNT